ncbi:FAD-dependent pyridine nucleotide-disulphide oxidoreductase (plasmid) [Pseudarthrobacter chlorophenolicus A6]|uniref:FAD-dependent pyridine nucleotide-disulphide oxidoreductase n=1 Tax=Pseudarthrobacter chlorophenolicus (strain ATCC 700700 / DSM 12829 / CIP 107037 / JCM 12360 / KCTC 9906 / NCIMB 13794 / A6) TaxID=452863 RepID=B8HJ67_PSECP|nr:NAD(P)/FAD-dependent oxidoreductase [Pseudarthrobacter chlorophenolicus]ACL42465.1 FAD-dependent pyridine nucleotide-disulphide oxidoreductase [Pseudarthrobacter chlorophenolicus A6]SDQ09742.1 dihydrolipoamide dehydrogenase [Pseudarthrobacter chlorophenolicus]
MDDHFDVAVLGMGPGGEVAAGRLLKAGKKIAVIERELIGGECAYWACIPSKTVLRPPEARTEVQRAAGVSGAELDWSETSGYRDYMIRHLDDKDQIDGYARQGAEVIKGEARITGPGRILAGDRELSADHIIIATGSDPVLPTLEGLDQITAWTNRETYTATTLPERAVIIGGSAVGVETATFLARFGVKVTLIHRGDRLLGREESRAGELAYQYLPEAGVEIRLGVTARRGRREGDQSVLDLDDGTEVAGDVVVFATGRTPRTQGLGFEHAGVVLGDRGQVQVDEHCRAGENVWAIGDVTGIMPFTHVAKYQGRIAADAILGTPRKAFYEGIPRVVFADPEIAAAGLTLDQAGRRGLKTAAAEIDLAAAITRPWTYERDPRGHLGLLADTDRKVLIGAWAVAPMAGEWIHQASLAIRAQIPIETLRDQVAQYPTYHEAYQAALDKLEI